VWKNMSGNLCELSHTPPAAAACCTVKRMDLLSK